MEHFSRGTTYVPYRHFCGGVLREFMQSLYATLHGAMGSYLRDALQGGNADVAACLLVPRA
jgi:hypothetical protein